MKQHIAIEQLKELTPKQMDKFLAYMNDKDYMPHGSQMMLHNDGWYMAQFLNIGQMIEFLDVKVGSPYEGGFIDYKELEHKWVVNNGPYYYADELCDALWEAVKEVLNSMVKGVK